MKNIFLTQFLNYRKFDKRNQGFTLIEVLVVALMVGILSAIAAPSFLGFANGQRLRTAQSRVFTALKDAQSSAKSKKLPYQASFREKDGIAQYAIHPSGSNKPTTAAGWDTLPWQNLDSFIGIARISPEAAFNRTGSPGDNETFDLEPSASPSIVRAIAFGSQGQLVGSLTSPTVTIAVKSGNGITGRRACVTVTTILGATRSLFEGEGATCD